MTMKISNYMISIRAFKSYVREHLPETSFLRTTILSEPDELSPEAFNAKVPIWLQILNREVSRSPSV
jgi:hypothetical protein